MLICIDPSWLSRDILPAHLKLCPCLKLKAAATGFHLPDSQTSLSRIASNFEAVSSDADGRSRQSPRSPSDTAHWGDTRHPDDPAHGCGCPGTTSREGFRAFALSLKSVGLSSLSSGLALFVSYAFFLDVVTSSALELIAQDVAASQCAQLREGFCDHEELCFLKFSPGRLS